MNTNNKSAVNRREMMGSLLLASGAALSELRFTHKGEALKERGCTRLDGLTNVPKARSYPNCAGSDTMNRKRK